MAQSPFSVYILNAAGVRQGSGPLTTVTELDTTQRLDVIGDLVFSVSAADPRVSLITPGSLFDVYDQYDGYLGRFTFKIDGLNESRRVGELSVSAWDALDELRRQEVGFRRKYEFEPVDQVLEDLLLLLEGEWSWSLQADIGNTTVIYENESVFAAIDALRDRWDKHFRLTNGRTFEFGDFGADSGIRLFDPERFHTSAHAMRRSLGLITNIRRSRDATDVYNRIYPLGGGQGDAQLTIAGATLGTYTVNSATNRDGSLRYYIENAASIAEYGRRARNVTFTQISPLSNNDTDILRARNALKLAAEAYIARHLDAKTEYSVTFTGLQETLNVGDTVRLTYRGVTDDGVYLDVDEDFYVMDLSHRRSAEGGRSVAATISSVAERRTTDTDVMVDVVRDIEVLKLHIQPYPFWSEKSERDTIQASDIDEDNKQAVFTFEIDDSVTYVTKVRLRFKTEPPYTLSRNTFPLNYPTSFENAANPHQHFLPEGNTNEKYQITVSDYIFPVNLSLSVDGVDVTSQLGGPWNADERVEPIDVALDITDIVRNSALGLRGDHSIVFTAGERRGRVDTPNSADNPITDDNASQGWILINLRVQGIAQAITPT